MRLQIRKAYDNDYAGGRGFDGYEVVEHKTDDEYYAKCWSLDVAKACAGAIEKLLR
jgi:hypothetical protein